MRLMLGFPAIYDIPEQPILLVAVNEGFDPGDFDFEVINGLWTGQLKDGKVYIGGVEIKHARMVEILCNDQDRLRGDYQDVFANFDNPNYKAPVPKYREPREYYDDGIPF